MVEWVLWVIGTFTVVLIIAIHTRRDVIAYIAALARNRIVATVGGSWPSSAYAEINDVFDPRLNGTCTVAVHLAFTQRSAVYGSRQSSMSLGRRSGFEVQNCI